MGDRSVTTLPVHRKVECLLRMAEFRSLTLVQREYFACLTNHRQNNTTFSDGIKQVKKTENSLDTCAGKSPVSNDLD